MRFAPQVKIPATYMRGGTSKGVFFKLDDLVITCHPYDPPACGANSVVSYRP